jgi:hypothetical protein
VLDIYADDFVHKTLVALTTWPDIPEEDKDKAFNLLLAFVSDLIERVGIHSVRSSTYGLNPENLNMNYRSCQRAGTKAVTALVFCSCLWRCCFCCCCCVFEFHSGLPVLLVNMYKVHAASALRPQDIPITRQSVSDLASCIAGAKASGHSTETLPAYVEVHRKLESLLRSSDASA